MRNDTKISVKKKRKYPAWVCFDCGIAARGKPMRSGSCATYHKGKCGVCGETKPVIEPRDFGYPEFNQT